MLTKSSHGSDSLLKKNTRDNFRSWTKKKQTKPASRCSTWATLGGHCFFFKYLYPLRSLKSFHIFHWIQSISFFLFYLILTFLFSLVSHLLSYLPCAFLIFYFIFSQSNNTRQVIKLSQHYLRLSDLFNKIVNSWKSHRMALMFCFFK